MHDLASVTDADIAAMHAEPLLPRSSLFSETPRRNLTHELFQYDKYDWSNWDDFGTSYVPFKLNKGYFTYVERDRVGEINDMFSHSFANVQRYRGTEHIQKIYAVVGGKGQPQQYLHRFLADVTDGLIKVDHSTGLSLDNRDTVLKRKKHFQNIAHHDSSLRRSTNVGLKRGVYQLKRGEFRAQIKHKGVTHRSPYWYDTEDAAHAWYCRKFKELFKFDFVDLSQKPNFPVFPPLKDDTIRIPF